MDALDGILPVFILIAIASFCGLLTPRDALVASLLCCVAMVPALVRAQLDHSRIVRLGRPR